MSEDLELRLARLAESTATIRARRGFSQRVLVSIQREAAGSFRASLSRGVRRFVPFALLFALAAVFWAIDSESTARQLMATSYGALELEW